MSGTRNDPYWWRLKDEAKLRAGTLCEYCRRRGAEELHHRTYLRDGHEDIGDVMLVCDACHRAIHHGAVGLVVEKGSLADLGDSGRGVHSKLWQNYLQHAKNHPPWEPKTGPRAQA